MLTLKLFPLDVHFVLDSAKILLLNNQYPVDSLHILKETS